MWCVVAEQKGQELQQLAIQQPVRDVLVDVGDLVDDGFGADAIADEDAGRLRAGLAGSLGVPVEAIDVIVEDVDGTLQVQYAVVFLDVRSARRLGGLDKSK